MHNEEQNRLKLKKKTGKQSNSETAEFKLGNMIHHRPKQIKIQNKQDNNQT